MEILNLKTKKINQNYYHQNIFTRNKIGALYTFPKQYTPEDCLACDGYILKIVDFSELYEILGTTFNSGEEAKDEFRIPDYNLTGRFLQPGNQNHGSIKVAGVPSIKLALRVDAKTRVDTYYGSKYLSSYGTDDYGGAMSALSDGSDEPMRLMNDATSVKYKAGDLILDSNIYGKSNTVQPPSQIVHVCIKYK